MLKVVKVLLLGTTTIVEVVIRKLIWHLPRVVLLKL